ncbi:uncharacterized protein G2W53_031264 [Senna tora]|uniref:Uncharacterized protein n=1 Tax=Senna tora TaxID=362788 RepID=A0A834WBM0_9FABA|nr:uncharacterized protein G2W53_031264 [Senna tora]
MGPSKGGVLTSCECDPCVICESINTSVYITAHTLKGPINKGRKKASAIFKFLLSLPYRRR